MKWLFQPLLLLLARSSDSELARYVEFLKAENQILRRRLPKRLNLLPSEKRLILKLGLAIGPAAENGWGYPSRSTRSLGNRLS